MCNNVSRIADKLDEMELDRHGYAQAQQQQVTQPVMPSVERPESTATAAAAPVQNGMSQEEMQKRLEAKNAAKKIQSGQKLDESWRDILIKYPQTEVIEPLIKQYVDIYHGGSGNFFYDRTMPGMIQQVISACPRGEVIDYIYKDRELLKDDAIKSLISDCRLFDAAKILDLCKTDIHIAFNLLDCDAPSYSDGDIAKMKEIIAVADALPILGKLEQETGNPKYICPNGHKNKGNTEYCKLCGLNTKGLNRNEVKNIELLRNKIEILGAK